MARDFFSDLPDTTTPIRASRLNGLLNGDETMGSIVVDDINCKNLFNAYDTTGGWLNSSGVVTTSSTNLLSNFIPLKANQDYILSANTTFKGLNFAFYDASKTFIATNTGSNVSSKTINSGSTYKYCRIWVNYNETAITPSDLINHEVQLEQGNIASDYMAYNQPVKYQNGLVKENTTFYANDFKCKNLIDTIYSIPNKTSNGVTFTNNEDGTITANGTASGGNASINLYTNDLSLKAGTYILSGCPSGGSSAKYYIATNISGASVFDYGSGVAINIPSDVTNKSIWIAVVNGQSVSNLVFKPQLEVGSEATPFTPYKNFDNTEYVAWTNPTPNATFDAQQITLNDDVSKYKKYEVLYKIYYTGNYIISSGKLPIGPTTLFFNDQYNRIRDITAMSDTSMTFGVGRYYASYGNSNATTNNAFIVPVQVILYK